MIAQVEDLLLPLNDFDKNSESSCPRAIIIELLRVLEITPITAKEKRLIETTVDDFRGKFSLLDDNQLDCLLKKRFSYDFLPFVSKLDLDPSISQSKSEEQTAMPSERPISPKPINKVISVKAKGYMMCSIIRHQSTLWTSYRMYLDGTKDISSTGELFNFVKCEEHVMLLGTKKLKSGISTSCLVWRDSDSKTWKDKNAVAKITRTNSTYIGSAVNNNGQSGAGGISEPTTPTATKHVENDGGEVTNDVDVEDSGYEIVENVALSTSFAVSHAAVGSPIALSVTSKGLDKLIYLNAVAAKNHLSSSVASHTVPSSSSSSSSHSPRASFSLNIHSLQTVAPIADGPDDVAQVADLEKVLKILTSNGVLGSDNSTTNLSSKYLVLKSRLPRKALTTPNSTSTSGLNLIGASAAKQNIHTLAFGKDTRVKSVSRKNLVVDSVYDISFVDDSGGGSGLINTEWTNEGDRPPILEIGKMEEDVFAVDFYHLTPFQAFTIAIAAFDQ